MIVTYKTIKELRDYDNYTGSFFYSFWTSTRKELLTYVEASVYEDLTPLRAYDNTTKISLSFIGTFLSQPICPVEQATHEKVELLTTN